MNRYFGYIRVSTARQGERGVSLPEQKDAIERYASRFNLPISSWFEERETAAKRGRPVWTKMLRLLRLANAHGVVIHKIDRSARNLKDWADLGELIDSGIEVHFANESLDLHSRGGRLSADIQAVVAADYIRNLREEAKKGIYGRLKQGLYPSRAPIGYLDQGGGKPKAVDPVKGPLIKKAFALYATTRFSMPTLADELYRLGLRNHANGKVSVNGLSTLLNNPFYMGLIRIKKTGQIFEGKHEPLISKRLFDDVQDVIAGRLNKRPTLHEFLFRKIVRCKLCGYALIGELQKNHVYYRCHISTCPTTSIREEVIEETVIDRIQNLNFTAPEKKYLTEAVRKLKVDWIALKERQLSTLDARRQSVSERLTRLTDAYLDRMIEKDIFEERKAALLFERREIDDQIADLKSGKRSVPDELQKFLELAGDAYLLYKSGIPEKKRELLKIFTSNLAVEHRTLDFALSLPFSDVANRENDTDGRAHREITRTLDALLKRLLSHFENEPAVHIPELPGEADTVA